MAPPRKAVEDGEVDFHVSHAPLSTPLSFVSPTVLCYVAGNSVCLLDLEESTRSYLYTTAYGIARLASCPAKKLLAFCEGGTNPHVFVYSVDPTQILYTLSGVTELELADLAFSRCGSRLYALSRASSKRLTIFSMVTGQRMQGCELDLPMRFDKISVFPGHKDNMAVVRISSARIVSLTKSFETYIFRLQPQAIPADVDITISAFSWTPSGNFLFGTRQGSLCTLDGTTGALLHVCQAMQPITSIAVTQHHILTAHIGNRLNFWSYDSAMLAAEGPARLDGVPQPMEGALGRPAVYNLRKSTDLQRIAMNKRPEQRIVGQIAHIQVAPGFLGAAITTAEGEVWNVSIPAIGPEEGQEPDDGGELQADKLPMSLLAWFHTHPISDVILLGRNSQVAASADEGGRLRIWEVNRGPDPKGFRMLRFTSAVTSLTSDVEGKLLIVGSDSGCLHVVSTEDWRQARVVNTQRISDAGVMQLRSCTHSGRCAMVAASLLNHKVALLSVMYRDPKLRMCGFVEIGLNSIVEDICFHVHDFKPESVMPAKLAVVGTTQVGDASTSCIWYFKSPPLDYDPSIAELKKDTCPVWSSKLNNTGKPEDRVTCVASASKKSVVVGFAGGAIRIFSVPTSPGLPSKNMQLVAPLAELHPHDQFVTCMRVSVDGTWLVSASMDGEVRRMQLEPVGKQPQMQKVIHSPYNGGVSQVSASEDAKLIASTGGADGIMVWSDPSSALKVPDVPEASLTAVDDKLMETAILDVDDRNLQEYPVWMPVSADDKAAAAAAEAGDDPELSAVAAAQRKALLLEVDGLRKKLTSLVDQNSACPDLEKIDRNEFCVDFEQRDSLAAKTKERCDILRAQLERENLARQLTRHRLVKEFWDPMKSKGCMITSLMSNLSVSNYPERTISAEESGTTKKLRILRQVEQLESDMPRGAHRSLPQDVILTSKPFTTGREQYIVNWWSKTQDAEKKKKPEVDAGGEGAEAGGEEAKDEAPKEEEEAPKQVQRQVEANAPIDQKYLYEPFELVTNTRRRLQVHLLQSLAAEYRASFNTLFKEAQVEKKDVLNNISEKVKRMRAILGELQVLEEVPEPVLQDHEESEAVLNVKDAEIKAEKFISEEQKKIDAEISRKEEERLRLLRENDAGTRALMQMMGGTLKTKKDLSALEIVLDREPWMDSIPREDMTEAQLAALTEFEGKEKALAEEQDKYKKMLDAELKKLRLEVQEVTQAFEVVLKELHHQRFSADARFFCQELYCVRLQLALLQNVEDNHVLEQTTRDVDSAEKKVRVADQKLDTFRREVQEKKDKQDERVRHEREVASAQYFRSQFAQSGLEAEQVTQILQIFRRKRDTKAGQGERKSVSASPGSPSNHSAPGSGSADPYDAVHTGDPYADLGTNTIDPASEVIEDDIAAEDCPENVDEASFARMIELRRERLFAEMEVGKGAAVLQEMAGLLAHYQRERDDAKFEYDQLLTDFAEHSALMDREQYDVEILFKLRQGQVEVPQAAVVTDYSDAVVIDTEVVESRNRRIKALGKDKIGILETTMEFRKQLNLIQWEHKMLALQTSDLEERTKDVHMLRVTKGLQSLLKGGEEGRNKAEADLLERKIEHLNTNMQQKEQSLKKQYAMGARATKLRKMENDMLDKKLRELQQNVIQREHIRRLRAPQGGGAGGGGAKEGERPRIVGGGGRIEENEAVIRAAQVGFREVRTRQSLMDAAKKHTEEIDLLNRELDRLRQRTFPSFVQLHEERSANPDMV
jgi:WD40 repeat protein